MTTRPYDEERASVMLHALRDVEPDQRLDTLAVVVRCWLDAHPGRGVPARPILAEFFQKGDSHGGD